MALLELVFLAVIAFLWMEIFSYVAHRYVYHGFLWAIHRSHHTARTGPFELNDLFPVFLSLATMGLLLYALVPPVDHRLLAVTIGITAYGATYLFLHDFYVHRRLKLLGLRIPFLATLKKAHAIHHRDGGEPYGLLLFPRLEDLKRVQVKDEDPV
jgi:beta-carotene 3-hydroxylase